MGPIWDLFKAALGLTVDVTRDMVTAYLKLLQTLAKWSMVLALALLPLPIIGSLLHFSWMSGVYLAVVGILITIWLIAAFPVVMLVRYAYEEIKSIKKTAQLIGGILFWILLLSIYFYLIPVWNYPAAIPLVFIICAVLALGLMRFGIGISPRLAIGAVLIVFCLITISFYMPTSRSAANTLVGWLDGQVAGLITSPLHPTPQLPKRIAYDLTSIEKIQFFDVLTSEPKIWYYKSGDGGFELFDGPGHHPHYKLKLEPIIPDVVAQIKTKLIADAQRVGRVPNRMDYDHISVQRIVFFDPVTSDAKVWYYKADDGRFDLFDGPGYHPQYKEKLQAITSEIVAEIKSKLKADAERIPQVPKRIDYDHISIERIVFFDPSTAEPKVWYFKDDDGRLDLFDGPGYHPQYKEKLQPITPDIVAQIRKQLKADAERRAEQAKKQEAQKILEQKRQELPKNAIIGRWQEIDGTETVEFFMEDTFNVVVQGMSMTGRYNFLDEGRIKLESDGISSGARSIICRVSVSENELTFTSPDGKVKRYRRIKWVGTKPDIIKTETGGVKLPFDR